VHITSSQSPPLLSPSITPPVFHSSSVSQNNPFLHSHSYSFRTAFADLETKWALAFVCFSFFFFIFFLATCARLNHSAFESTLNSSFVLCRINTPIPLSRYLWPMIDIVTSCLFTYDCTRGVSDTLYHYIRDRHYERDSGISVLNSVSKGIVRCYSVISL